ncbi:hypothetical protein CPR19088_GLDEOEPO_02173 [Companilactobacillus paralimentarius]
MAFGFLLLFNLGNIPGLHTDETNYMNEVISKANFGTDIHGLKHPIYFASVWGQGQSVLYSWIVTPFIKLWGFSIFLFRLPMALLTILTILGTVLSLYFTSKDKWFSFCITLAMVTTPWFFISGRWVLDANISPIFVMLGLIFMYISTVNTSQPKRYVFLLCSAILLSLSAYGYVASWLYLPFLITMLFFTGLLKKWFSIKEMLAWSLVILILVFPLIVFAYRVNVQHIDKITRFMFLDLPYLQANRVSSLISTDGSILANIKENIIIGIQQVGLGSDHLPQNSAYPYGVIFPLMLVFTVIGMFGKKTFINNNVSNFRVIMLEALITFIPGIMIIRPNYNHWNFLWFPLAVLTGYGLYLSFQAVGKLGKTMLVVAPIAMFVLFSFNSYFGFNHKDTTFNDSLGSVNETKHIDNLMHTKFKNHSLYIENLSSNFNNFRLVEHPINSSQYLEMQHGVKRDKNKIVPSPAHAYGYLRDGYDIAKAKHGDEAMIFDANLNSPGSIATDKQWHLVKDTYFNHQKVEIFQKE